MSAVRMLRRPGVALLAAALVVVLASCTTDGSGTGSTTSVGATAGSTTPGAPRRIIISTDMAMGLVNGRFDGPGAPPVDDAYAIALAFAHPEAFDVAGIVTTFGNSHVVAAETEATRRLLDVIGRDGDLLATGAAIPSSNPPVEWFSGELIDGLCVNEGVERMADLLTEAPATIVAIGPFTDVACLIEEFPDLVDSVDGIVALTGARPGTALELGGTPVPDLNFTSDPLALQVILEDSEIPVTVMTFEVTSTVDLDLDAFNDAIEAGNDVAQYYRAGSGLNAAQFSSISFEIFDSHTVWYLLDPTAYTCDEVGFRLTVGQPSAEPSPENDDRFAPDLPGRRVRACSAFAAPDGGSQLDQATVDAVISLGS